MMIATCLLGSAMAMDINRASQETWNSAGGCNDFKMKCQTYCNGAQGGGVVTNQCWGAPTQIYTQCKCQNFMDADGDGKWNQIYLVPGWTCMHTMCTDEMINHNYQKQIDSGITFLKHDGTTVKSTATSPSTTSTPSSSSTSSVASSGNCITCEGAKSVSGYSSWTAATSADGSAVAVHNGAPLLCSGGKTYAYFAFDLANSASAYGTVDIALGNRAEAWNVVPKDNSKDISAGSKITLTYQSNADMWLQIRHGANKHGGHHWRVKLPRSPTMKAFDLPFNTFAQPSWVSGAEKYDLNLKDVFSFTLVAVTDAKILIQGLEVNNVAAPGCTNRGTSCGSCSASMPSIASAVAAPQPSPTPAPKVALSGTPERMAAQAAVNEQNAKASGTYQLLSVKSSSEKHTVGYVWEMQILVFGPSGQETVAVTIASNTARDVYQLRTWDVINQNSIGGSDNKLLTSSDCHSHEIFDPSRNGCCTCITADRAVSCRQALGAGYGGNVGFSHICPNIPQSATQNAVESSVSQAQKPQQQTQTSSTSLTNGRPATTGSAPTANEAYIKQFYDQGHYTGDVRTDLNHGVNYNNGLKIYSRSFKNNKGTTYPAIDEMGNCVDIPKPWPVGYMPCCSDCYYPEMHKKYTGQCS